MKYIDVKALELTREEKHIYSLLDEDSEDNIVSVNIAQNEISISDVGEVFLEDGVTCEIYEL